MTIFVVDFNQEDDKGRIPARLGPAEKSKIRIGELVTVQDEEGYRCQARVDEISEARPAVFLVPIESTWEGPSPKQQDASLITP